MRPNALDVTTTRQSPSPMRYEIRPPQKPNQKRSTPHQFRHQTASSLSQTTRTWKLKTRNLPDHPLHRQYAKHLHLRYAKRLRNLNTQTPQLPHRLLRHCLPAHNQEYTSVTKNGLRPHCYRTPNSL